ncbi:MAG: hypothetical protein ACKVOM_01820 [Ferruginibacter sp.]
MRILIVFFLCLPFCLHAQSVITGTVTHSFNANADGKPDAGSKVFVVKYEGDAIAIYETIDNFLAAKKYRSLNGDVGRLTTIYKDSAAVVKGKRQYEEKYTRLQNIIAQIKADADARNAKLQQLGAETNAKFDLMDQRTAKALSQAKLKAADMRTIADAAGSFSIKIEAGKYMLFVVSGNRTGLSSTEISGKIFVQLVDVKDGEPLKVTTKFIPD